MGFIYLNKFTYLNTFCGSADAKCLDNGCPTVLKQLGTANRRSMGLTSSVRVPARIVLNTLTEKSNARDKVLH